MIFFPTYDEYDRYYDATKLPMRYLRNNFKIFFHFRYSRMSDLPHHCLHVVSDSALVLRPSISDDRLFLCSVKNLFSEEDEESSPELKFFEREETLEDGDSSKSKCQVM